MNKVSTIVTRSNVYYLVLKIDDLKPEKPECAALEAYIRAVNTSHPFLAKDLERYLPTPLELIAQCKVVATDPTDVHARPDADHREE